MYFSKQLSDPFNEEGNYSNIATFNSSDDIWFASGILDTTERDDILRPIFFSSAALAIYKSLNIPTLIDLSGSRYSFSTHTYFYKVQTGRYLFPKQICWLNKHQNFTSSIIVKYFDNSNTVQTIDASNITLYKDGFELEGSFTVSEHIEKPIIAEFTLASNITYPSFLNDLLLKRAEVTMAMYFYRNRDGGIKRDFEKMLMNFNHLISRFNSINVDLIA